MINSLIPRNRFSDVFQRLNWVRSDARSGNYDVWTSTNVTNLWTVIPKNEKSEDYLYCQDKNIKILLQALGLEENDFNMEDLRSQLSGYNYKLINRIVSQDNRIETVPFEMADVLSSKNIDAFRFYYQTKTRGKNIPIESFRLHHTQEGSFVIPISIVAEQDQESLLTMPTHTNSVIRDYLKTLEVLFKVPHNDEKAFADKVIDSGIDSKIVKVFLGNSDSVAKTKLKYQVAVKEISVSSSGSPILDYHLEPSEKKFPVVDMSKIQVLEDNFLEFLEGREIEADSATIEESGVKINVAVDSLDQNGTVKFSVFGINGQDVTKSFKARSTKLTKNTLNYLTDAFKSREVIEVTGDITKSKGKVGEIIGDKFDVIEPNPTLFDG